MNIEPERDRPRRTGPTSKRMSLLLVEDNPADAEIVREMLIGSPFGRYETLEVGGIAKAVEVLHAKKVDAILLDLRLPDGVGVETVIAVREAARETPIVVLTGTDDEALALQCIDAGAQDYLCKGEISPSGLRRAIGYAITRLREAQLRELQEALKQYRSLTTEGSKTTVTAAVTGVGSVRERDPGTFAEAVQQYLEVLGMYLDQLVLEKNKPIEEMRSLVTKLGDIGGGPRDLLDVHVTALERAVAISSQERACSLVVEGRLLALEIMGLLVDYYRLDSRRATENIPPGGVA